MGPQAKDRALGDVQDLVPGLQGGTPAEGDLLYRLDELGDFALFKDVKPAVVDGDLASASREFSTEDDLTRRLREIDEAAAVLKIIIFSFPIKLFIKNTDVKLFF